LLDTCDHQMTPIRLMTALLGLLLGQTPAGATETRQRVMLQGSSAAALGTLVEAAGGRTTHSLPIIDAIGAELDPAQLLRLRDEPAIGRIIDDLDREGPEPEIPDCQLAGALELRKDGHRYHWRLYNKGGKPASVADLRFGWPRNLGALTTLTLGSKSLIDAPRESDGSVHTLVPVTAASIAPGERVELSFGFEERSRESRLWQDELDLGVSFGSGCEVNLIPGYRNSSGDTYYPTLSGADLLHRHGITGAGITVAVLDSGLWDDQRLTHDTRGEYRVIASYDAIADSVVDVAFDESGHGSHMTSILAQSRPVIGEGTDPGSFRGIAPDARLVVVKAFNREGQGEMLDIVRGVQWIVDNKERHNIRVLNLSFAARPRWPYWLDPINQAIMRAWQAGIVVVAAAGNEGPESMSVGSPGNLPYIITVGAVTDSWTVSDRTDDYLPDFSSRGPTPSAHIKPDIVAPGGHMAGLTRPGSTLTKEFPEYLLADGDFVMTGTSQAAALVSGLTALLLQIEPDLSPDEVKCKFMSSADPAIDSDGRLSYSPFEQGAGYVSIQRAITLGDSACGNTGLDIAREISGDTHFEGPAILLDNGRATLPGLHEMIAMTPPEKGQSDTRRWGIKAHIERDTASATPEDPNLPFDWPGLYAEEKARMEALGKTPPAGPLR
jgi:hypothetical protein